MEVVTNVKVISVDEFEKMVREGKIKVTDTKVVGGDIGGNKVDRCKGC